jgi:hypothetical protein
VQHALLRDVVLNLVGDSSGFRRLDRVARIGTPGPEF